MTYEGTRSDCGNYLNLFGTSSFTMGLVTEIEEFMGYFFRIISGFFINKIGKSWTAP